MKQVIILRKFNNMRTGKYVAQGSHASLTSFIKCKDSVKGEWIDTGQKKIVLYVEKEKDLIAIYRLFIKKKLPCVIIKDSGKTEFKGIPTLTAIACIGSDEELDLITGNLPLF